MTNKEAIKLLTAYTDCIQNKQNQTCEEKCYNCQLFYDKGTSIKHLEAIRQGIEALETLNTTNTTPTEKQAQCDLNHAPTITPQSILDIKHTDLIHYAQIIHTNDVQINNSNITSRIYKDGNEYIFELMKDGKVLALKRLLIVD